VIDQNNRKATRTLIPSPQQYSSAHNSRSNRPLVANYQQHRCKKRSNKNLKKLQKRKNVTKKRF